MLDRLIDSQWMLALVGVSVLLDVFLPVLPSGVLLITAATAGTAGSNGVRDVEDIIELMLCAAVASCLGDLAAYRLAWRGGDWLHRRIARSRRLANAQERLGQVLLTGGGRLVVLARFADGRPFRPVEIRGIYADGDTVIVLWDGHGVANDGQPYDNSYAWFMRLEQGKVVDGTAFYDSISFNDLWSRVQAE